MRDLEKMAPTAATATFWQVINNLKEIASQTGAARLRVGNLVERCEAFIEDTADAGLARSSLFADLRHQTEGLRQAYRWYIGGEEHSGRENAGGRRLLLNEGFDGRILRRLGSFEEERSSQSSLSLIVNASVVWHELRPILSATGWERLKHVASKESALGLMKPPTQTGTQPLSTSEFAAALNLRLGLLGFHTPLAEALCDSTCHRCGTFILDAEELSRVFQSGGYATSVGVVGRR